MNTNNIFKWTLALAIVIVLNLFFNFAIKLIYKAPVYDDFCKAKQVNVPPKTQDACLAVGGQWNENYITGDYYRGGVMPVKPMPVDGEVTGYCYEQFTCQKDYNNANKLYNRNVFLSFVVLGLASLFAGYYLGESAPVSLGLSLGGVLSFIIGTIHYWSDMDDYLRVIVLGIALVSLIWFGIKKFNQ